MGSRRRVAGALLVTALLAASCGTRSERAPDRAATSAGPGQSPAAPDGPLPAVGGTGAADAADTGATGTAPAPSGGSATPSPKSAASPPAGDPGATARPRPAAAGATGTARESDAPANGPVDPPAPPSLGGQPAEPGASGTKSTIVIASVGILSGPVGSVLLPTVQAVQAWVAYTNDKGGLNGHKIRYVLYDDGADPARHKAQVQEAVEKEKVIAFVQNPEGTTGQPSQAYLTAKRVPVIGSEGGAQWFYESPMYFPQVTHGSPFFNTILYGAAQALIPAGKTKLATATCVEIAVCAENDRVWAEAAPGAGFHHVYRGRTSIGNPDYSAECLAARNAGAEIFLISVDTSSIGRIALSCARQGYKPTFGVVGAIAGDRMKDDPNLQGMIAASNAFPYFQSGTPATDEYQKVMGTYGRKVPPGVGPAVGWVAAKLFEKAAARMTEPPSSEAVLRGLWSIRDDTLGGLTYPMTFVENQNAKQVTCWFTITVKDRRWVSPDNYQLHCH